MHRIHIVGVSPRSGTTLLAECMKECFEIDICEDVEVPLSRLRWTRGTYLTKSPGDIQHVKLRLNIDPRLYVICMMRDPRDVIISKHQRNPVYYHVALDTWKKGYACIKDNISHPRFMVVKYEDLIDNPDQVQASIGGRLAFLKQRNIFSKWHLAATVSPRYEVALNGIRAIDCNNKTKWPSQMERIQRQIDLFGPVTNELIEMGYETDASWMHRAFSTPQHNQQLLEKIDNPSLRRRLLRKKHDLFDYPVAALMAAACSRLSVDCG